MTKIAVVDRSARGKLRLTGPQRAWFLHQVLTQSVEDMEPGEAREAAMLTAHGRMVAYLDILARADDLLVHFEEELRDTWPEALRRYVFATRVEIHDETDAWALLFVHGDGWQDAVRAAQPDAVLHPASSFGGDSGHVWVAPALAGGITEDERFEVRDGSFLEALRIERGVPRWGRDMNDKTIPQEVGLDRFAIHFDKGCYVGQEAMAKIHFRGKVNRKLARVRVDGPAPTTLTFDGRDAGRVTTPPPNGGVTALAILRHDVPPGATLESESGTVVVEEVFTP